MRENDPKPGRMKSANKALFELMAGACKWKSETVQTDNKNDKERERSEAQREREKNV